MSYATKNIWHYASYAFAINAAYAEHNGYSIKLFDEDSLENSDRYDDRWSKIAVLLDSLDPRTGWGRYADYLVWIDGNMHALTVSLCTLLMCSGV